MVKYGLTPQGPNPKRLDVILEQMHQRISDRVGVNTRQNRESLLNHLLTNIAYQIADLWEYGTGVYYSQYISSAEGVNLDNAAQFGGTTRGVPEKSYYHILCTGVDGTVVPSGTIIASDTNPAINLNIRENALITRGAFNKAEVIMAAPSATSALGIALNGTLYTVTPDSHKSIKENLQALADVITDENFVVEVLEDAIAISSVDEIASNAMVLSENLTTRTVSSVITFATEEDGDILIPNGAITKIVKSVPGMTSIVNVGPYIAGRLAETDVEFRRSYADKIFNRSSTMIESIRSAILMNVQGVISCAVYENTGDVVDEAGRYPHSVEVVADGGDRTEIAQQILNKKAGGINTYGSVEVELPGEYGEKIIIRFNRPTKVYVWFRVGVVLSKTQNPPVNYVDLIKEQIIEGVSALSSGDDVIPQNFLPKVYGIDYMDITLAATTEQGDKPPTRDKRSATISERERATTDETRIEVVLDG